MFRKKSKNSWLLHQHLWMDKRLLLFNKNKPNFWPKSKHKLRIETKADRFILLQVARVVNLKLAFTDWFFDNLIILIKLCKMQYLNLDKALLFLRSQVICLKNWKLWRAPTTVESNILCWNFAHVSYLTMSTKRCSGFF